MNVFEIFKYAVQFVTRPPLFALPCGLTKSFFSLVVYQNAASGAPCGGGSGEQADSWLIAV